LERQWQETEGRFLHRAFQSSDVPDGVGMLVGDLCWDYGNEDAYICTVAATTVVKLNA